MGIIFIKLQNIFTKISCLCLQPLFSHELFLLSSSSPTSDQFLYHIEQFVFTMKPEGLHLRCSCGNGLTSDPVLSELEWVMSSEMSSLLQQVLHLCGEDCFCSWANSLIPVGPTVSCAQWEHIEFLMYIPSVLYYALRIIITGWFMENVPKSLGLITVLHEIFKYPKDQIQLPVSFQNSMFNFTFNPFTVVCVLCYLT